jgi:hypothetical protein
MFFMRTPINRRRSIERRPNAPQAFPVLEFKLIRGANSFYSVQLCDIDCVCCRNATALRRRTLPELIHGICNFSEAHAGDSNGVLLVGYSFCCCDSLCCDMLDFQRESPR